jgi:glycine cleavage system regulatory protein
MRTSLVLTVIGDDKPGIVEQLSDQILASGANWEESRMARLGGKFAGLLRLTVDLDRADALAAGLTRFETDGLAIVVERSEEPNLGAYRTVRLELLGQDRKGIVRDISRALAQRKVNIEELETDVTSAPTSGDALFRARAVLGVPASVTTEMVRDLLEAIADELMVDLMVDDPNSSASGDVAGRPEGVHRTINAK